MAVQSVPQIPRQTQPWGETRLPKRVRDWLRERAESCFCDDCVAGSNETLRQKVRLVTARISVEAGFARYHGRCDACSQSGLVTFYSGRQPWAG
jgi:hypothetical protein